MSLEKTLVASSKYRKFTQDRNQALEQINLNTQMDLSRILHNALENITNYVSRMALERDPSVYSVQRSKDLLDFFVSQEFERILPWTVARMKRGRKASFYLTYFGELEAIARATQKTKIISSQKFKQQLHDATHQDTVNGQSLEKSVWLSFLKLQNDIVMAFVRALLNESSPLEVVKAVQQAYPQIQSYRRPPRKIKPLREADSDPGQEYDFYHGLTNDQDWEEAVQAYKDAELPAGRFDQFAVSFDPEAGYFAYGWEQEQNANDDFVQAVRAGQVAGAEEMGIKDFVWIAVIDNKTCHVCCLPRNGKTTSEIESMLASGKLDASRCDAVTPPAHPYCRCDIGPVASTDEVSGPNWKDFGDWLES